MGLYLCIFDGEDELDGVEVGHYADFAELRDAVRDQLEGGVQGRRFPVLMLHSDCDGEWTPTEASTLTIELRTIEAELSTLPARPLKGWHESVARKFGLKPQNLAQCFFDVDGESLFERLKGLCEIAMKKQLPIVFQ